MVAAELTSAPSTERDRISRALIDLCFEHGYRDTTLPMLLAHAEVNQETFERHFADLEDCFCEVLQERANEYMLRVAGGFAAAKGWRNQLRAAGYASLRFLREDVLRARLLFLEVNSGGTRAQLIRDQGMDALCEPIDLGRGELANPNSVPRSTAESLVGGVYNRTYLAIDRDDPKIWARMVQEFMYSLVLPYLGFEVALEELKIPPPNDLDDAAVG